MSTTTCQTPFGKIDKMTGESLSLPCGRCPNCLKRRISGWSYRLMKQEQISECSFFLTLTYDTKHVPISKNGFMSLDKTDLQKFFKRLRKLHEKKYGKQSPKISYYACGEYGGNTNRPHYHLIMFNADSNLIDAAWSLDAKPIGGYHIGHTTEASVGYTLKYMCKPTRIPMFARDDRQKEFSLMSKGLGANYLTSQMIEYHKADLTQRMFIPLPDGKKIAMPRYYKLKIYTELERVKIGKAAKIRANEEYFEQLKEHGDNLEQFQLNKLTEGIRKNTHSRINEKI